MTLMTRPDPDGVHRCAGVSWPLSISTSHEGHLTTPTHPAHKPVQAPVLRTGSLALRSSLRCATRFAPAARSHPAPLRSAGDSWERTHFIWTQECVPAPKGLGSRGARGGAQRRPAAQRLPHAAAALGGLPVAQAISSPLQQKEPERTVSSTPDPRQGASR